LKKKLSELAFIRTGLVTSRKETKDKKGDSLKYKQLNLRSINAKAYIDEIYLEDFYATEILKDEYLTQDSDIVVRLTYPYTAVYVDESKVGLLVPSHFIIIRVSREKGLLPEYLYWLLNTEQIKAKMKREALSGMIGAVAPKTYSDLDIDILTISEQKKIANVYQLTKRELFLIEQHKELKELYYTNVIDRIQKEMKEDDNNKK